MAIIRMAQPSVPPAKSRGPAPDLSAYLSNPGVSSVPAVTGVSMQRPHPLAQEGRMTDNKHSDAYREAMDDYEAAKAGAGNCGETFTRFLMEERVLAEPAAGTTGQTRRSPDTPLDFGPFTPEAN